MRRYLTRLSAVMANLIFCRDVSLEKSRIPLKQRTHAGVKAAAKR